MWVTISKLLICTKDDSRTVGKPISFIYTCVTFVISVGPPNSTTCKGPDNCGEDAVFEILP